MKKLTPEQLDALVGECRDPKEMAGNPGARSQYYSFGTKAAFKNNTLRDAATGKSALNRTVLGLEGYSVQLKNDLDGRRQLLQVILDYYQGLGRSARYFLESQNNEWGWSYLHFLVDRKNVIRYGVGDDRNFSVGGVEVAIGPHYFGPSEFWSYENSQRFLMSADTESVLHNLKLLDEFWGKAVVKTEVVPENWTAG